MKVRWEPNQEEPFNNLPEGPAELRLKTIVVWWKYLPDGSEVSIDYDNKKMGA